jgi:hypothetical protein
MICDLIRRASLVVLLLLASVGTASAECAWVLWSETEVWSPGRELGQGLKTPRAPFENTAECDKELMNRWRILQKHSGEDKIYPDGRRVEVVSGEHAGRAYVETRLTNADGHLVQTTTSAYQCWPDTIDPRGPKR